MKLACFRSVFASLLIVVLAAAVAHAAPPIITFAPASRSDYDSGGTGADQVILADVNNDGIADMVVCNTNAYSIYLGNGDGTFQSPNTYTPAGTAANLCAVADVNGDGYLDIVATTNYNANQTGGGVDVLLGNGDGTFNGPVSVNAGPIETFAVAVGDVDQDGHPDLVLTSNCQIETCLNGNVILLLGKGDGTFQSPIMVTAATGGPVALANMGNGNLDIVFNGGVLLGDGTADGVFTPVAGGELLGGAVSIAVADVNGDGFLDVVEVSDDNEVDVLLGNGSGALQQFANYKTGGDWPLSVTLADINGDGRPDVIVGNECQFTQKGTGKGRCNTVGGVSVLTNKGGIGPAFAGFNTAQIFPSGGFQASSVAVADVNGDGRPDLAISNLCMSTPNPDNTCPNDGWAEVMLNSSFFTTTTSLVSEASSPLYVNQPFVLQATVTSHGGVISNGDTVTFTQSANVLGTAMTSGGVATLPTSLGKAGTFGIKATFGGDVWNQTSFGTAPQVVSLYPTTTSVSTTPNPSAHGESITIMATVSSAAPGGATGTVQFKEGASLILGTAPLVSGTATLIDMKVLPSGPDTITANYLGDGVSAKSSGTTTQTVTP
jgi:hypothetical protein